MIKNIILDMGNVLFDYNPQIPLKQYCTDEQQMWLIRKELFEGQEWVLKDLGEISTDEAYERIAARIPKEHHQALKNCNERWTDSMLPMKNAQDFVENLMRQDYPVYILSNASTEFYDYFPRFRRLEDFAGVVVSSDVHMIKPDEKIYRYLLEKYRLKPEESLFIDDRPDNVEAAKKLGITAERFLGTFDDIEEKYQLRK